MTKERLKNQILSYNSIMPKAKLISVDMQKDFTSKRGKHYQPRFSVDFVKETVIPFLNMFNIKTSEIISDYRQPRPGDLDDSCNPGKWGYKSEIPEQVKNLDIWIKCMNSPIWVRENIGMADKNPGLLYQDPEKFTKWLESQVGAPNSPERIILFGLTLDCCVLCTAQELKYRGYRVNILEEGTDTYSGKLDEKLYLLNNPPLTNWIKSIKWNEAIRLL